MDIINNTSDDDIVIDNTIDTNMAVIYDESTVKVNNKLNAINVLDTTDKLAAIIIYFPVALLIISIMLLIISITFFFYYNSTSFSILTVFGTGMAIGILACFLLIYIRWPKDTAKEVCKEVV